jgi:hypothetical protein
MVNLAPKEQPLIDRLTSAAKSIYESGILQEVVPPELEGPVVKGTVYGVSAGLIWNLLKMELALAKTDEIMSQNKLLPISRHKISNYIKESNLSKYFVVVYDKNARIFDPDNAFYFWHPDPNLMLEFVAWMYEVSPDFRKFWNSKSRAQREKHLDSIINEGFVVIGKNMLSIPVVAHELGHASTISGKSPEYKKFPHYLSIFLTKYRPWVSTLFTAALYIPLIQSVLNDQYKKSWPIPIFANMMMAHMPLVPLMAHGIHLSSQAIYEYFSDRTKFLYGPNIPLNPLSYSPVLSTALVGLITFGTYAMYYMTTLYLERIASSKALQTIKKLDPRAYEKSKKMLDWAYSTYRNAASFALFSHTVPQFVLYSLIGRIMARDKHTTTQQ